MWIYSFLALLENPIVFEVCDILIKILRICLQCIENYDKSKNDYLHYKQMCNIIILIIREYFG